MDAGAALFSMDWLLSAAGPEAEPDIKCSSDTGRMLQTTLMEEPGLMGQTTDDAGRYARSGHGQHGVCSTASAHESPQLCNTSMQSRVDIRHNKPSCVSAREPHRQPADLPTGDSNSTKVHEGMGCALFGFDAVMSAAQPISPCQRTPQQQAMTPASAPSVRNAKIVETPTAMDVEEPSSDDGDEDYTEGGTADEPTSPAILKVLGDDIPRSSTATQASCRSRNPDGRKSATEIRVDCTPNGAADALLYKCPGKCAAHGVKCEGIYMSHSDICDQPDRAGVLKTDIARVRQRHHFNMADAGHRRAGNKCAVVTQLLWELTSGDEAVKVGSLQFKVGSRNVCQWCYMAAAGMLQQPGLARPTKRWMEGQTDYSRKERDSSPTKRQGQQLGISTLKTLWWGQKFRAAFAWIVQFCQVETGEDVQHGTTDLKVHIVGTTRIALKKQYDDWLAEKGRLGLICSQACFDSALREMNRLPEHPTLQMDRWSFHAECATCVAIKVLKRRAIASGDRVQIKLREAQLEHHKGQARNERLTYAWRIARGLHFKFCISICMDGYDNRKSSGPALYTKPIADCKGISGLGSAEQLKFKTTGVLVHGIGGYYVYVADPTIPANANFNLECLFITLVDLQRRVASGELPSFPPELNLQVDGASDNKAAVVFMFMEWLVRTRVFTSVVVSFMMVGHTHNDADQQFVPLTFELRKRIIKDLEEYLAAIRVAYKDPPKAVTHVQAVHDFTKWLKVDFGKEFAGFARRTPDAERPHQFTFELDDAGEVQMNYKQFSFDVESWNKRPIQLLSEVPDQPPVVEVPNLKHLEKLAASRPGVFKNFNMNLGDAQFFSADVIQQYTDMFDVFSHPDGTLKSLEELKVSMAAKVHPFTGLRQTVQDLETIMELAAADRGVEPVVHDNQTAAEKKEIRAHYKAKANETPRLSRGTKALNAATLRVMERLEQQHDGRLARAAEHAVFVDHVEIVGADASKTGYEVMYLCHWTHEQWAGHPKEFQWVPASDMGAQAPSKEKADSDEDYSEDDEHSDNESTTEAAKLPGKLQLEFTDGLLHQPIQVLQL